MKTNILIVVIFLALKSFAQEEIIYFGTSFSLGNSNSTGALIKYYSFESPKNFGNSHDLKASLYEEEWQTNISAIPSLFISAYSSYDFIIGGGNIGLSYIQFQSQSSHKIDDQNYANLVLNGREFRLFLQPEIGFQYEKFAFLISIMANFGLEKKYNGQIEIHEYSNLQRLDLLDSFDNKRDYSFGYGLHLDYDLIDKIKVGVQWDLFRVYTENVDVTNVNNYYFEIRSFGINFKYEISRT